MASVVDIQPQNLNPLQTGLGIGQGINTVMQGGMNNALMSNTLPSTIGARNAMNNAAAYTAMPNAQTEVAKANLLQRYPLLQFNPQIGSLQYLFGNGMGASPAQGQSSAQPQQNANMANLMPTMNNLQPVDPSAPQPMQHPLTMMGASQASSAQPVQNNPLANAFGVATLPNGQPDFPNLALNMLTADYRQKMAAANYQTQLANSIGTRYSTPMTKEQNMATLQGYGYPAAVAAQLAVDPIASQYITQNQVPYTQYVNGGVPHASPYVMGQNSMPPLNNQMMQPPASSIAPSNNIPAQPVTGAQPNLPAQSAPQVQIPMAAPAQNTQVNNSAGISAAPMPGATPPLSAQDQQAQNVAAQAQQQASQTNSALFKQTTTADQQQRLAAAARAVPALEQMYNLAPQALEYSGIMGRSKLLADQLAQSNDPRYLAYQQYKQAQAIAEPDTALGVGVHETDAGFAQFKPLFDIDNWKTNPQQAQALLKNSMQLIEKESSFNTQNMAQQANYINSNPVGQILSQPAAGSASSAAAASAGWQPDGTYVSKTGQRFTHDQLMAMQGGK